MANEDSAHFKQILLSTRAETFDLSLGLEAGWRALLERDAELEEEAQKMSLTSSYDQLALMDKRKIDEIDRALLKIEEGTFGPCERCGEAISRKRLEALPEATLCLSCMHRSEREKSRSRFQGEVLSCNAAPSGYEDLDDEDLVELITEDLRNDGRVDMQELDITSHGGTILLEGVLPSKEEHQILLRSILDFICSGSIMDRVEIIEATAGEDTERPERFVREDSRIGIPLEMAEEEITDDPFEMQEEDIPFDVPDRPPAETHPQT